MIRALSGVIQKLRRAVGPVAQARIAHPMMEGLEQRQMMSVAPIPLPKGIRVKNLFGQDGFAINSSLVTVPWDKTIRIKDASKIQVRGYIQDPITKGQRKVIINVLSVVRGGDSKSLIIETDRLMRKNGGKILIYDGALTDKNDDPIAAQTISSPKGQNKERFTLASRAFRPTSVDFFTQDLYGMAAPSIDVSTPLNQADVTAALTTFLDTKVSTGRITQADENFALALYNNPNTIAIIPDANMRAALVSLTGTVGEEAINAYLTGANTTGAKARFVGFDANVAGTVEVAETTLNKQGRLQTKFRTQYAGEPFQALSAVLAHEILHQDGPNSDGQQEEIVANAVQTIVWGQQLLVDAQPASVRSDLVRRNNDRLYAMLNSGKGVFPRLGFENAPLLNTSGGIFAGADAQTGGVYTSFEDYVRRLYAGIGIGDVNTGGNATWNDIYKKITFRQDTQTFTRTAIDVLDTFQQNITDKHAITLAGILKLTI